MANNVIVKLKLNTENEYLSLNKGKINNLESLTETNPNPEEIFYGSLANTGRIVVDDTDGEISNLISSGNLQASNAESEIFVNNNKLAKHVTFDSNYNVTTGEMSISLTDKIQQLEALKYDGYVYNNSQVTLLTLLEDVMSNITTESLADIMSSDIYKRAEETTITYPYIKKGRTFKSVLDEICSILECNIITDNNGKYKFVSARPIYSEDEKIIQIPNECIYETPSYTKILKNKYDGVTFPYSKTQVVADDVIFSSDTLHIYDGNTYIAENDGVNSNKYTIQSSFDMEYQKYIKITYTLDLSTVSKVRASGISSIKLKVTTFQNNYSYNIGFSIFKATEATTVSTGASSSIKIIEAIEAFDPLNSPRPSFTKSISGDDLTINLYIDVGGLPSGGYSSGSHPYDYPQTVSFQILDTTYNFESIEFPLKKNLQNALYLKSNADTLFQYSSRIPPKVIEVEKEKEWEYYKYLNSSSDSQAFMDTFEETGLFGIKYNRTYYATNRQWTTGFNRSGVAFENWFGEYLPYSALRYESDYYNGDFELLYDKLYPHISKYFEMNSAEKVKEFKSLEGKIVHFQDTNQYARISLVEKSLNTNKWDPIVLSINETDTPDLFNEFKSEIPKGTDGSFSIILKGYKIGLTFLAGVHFSIPYTISRHILSDYKNGISSGTAIICPTNLKYLNGEISKDWSKGEIICPNELIKFHDIDKVWRVTGVKYIYDGEPLIHISYQENILSDGND